MHDFPILKRKINGQRLVYLDNAATTQKPESVITAVSDFYRKHNANVHRGLHTLSQEADDLYGNARQTVQKFLNAGSEKEIIFTKGATESINLVAFSWGLENIKKGDTIVTTETEHHANLIPWQILAKRKQAKLKYIPVNKNGRLDLEIYKKLLKEKPILVALTHQSNVLGTINPVEKIIKLAHQAGSKILIDGAQIVAHKKVDVEKLDADFYVFSGHKIYGPTGIGVLYTKQKILENTSPYQFGGSMIGKVDFKTATWNLLPFKFEAGTPPIAQAVGLAEAIKYIEDQDFEKIEQHETKLTETALTELTKIKDLKIFGPQTTDHRGPVFSFTVRGVPAHDLAAILNEQGVAVRTGHHCAMPLHEKFKLSGTVRASFALYNTKSDIDKLVQGIKKAKDIFNLN